MITWILLSRTVLRGMWVSFSVDIVEVRGTGIVVPKVYDSVVKILGKHSTDASPTYPGGQVHLTLCVCAIQRAALPQLLVQRSTHTLLTQICACVQSESTVQETFVALAADIIYTVHTYEIYTS